MRAARSWGRGRNCWWWCRHRAVVAVTPRKSGGGAGWCSHNNDFLLWLAGHSAELATSSPPAALSTRQAAGQHPPLPASLSCLTPVSHDELQSVPVWRLLQCSGGSGSPSSGVWSRDRAGMGAWEVERLSLSDRAVRSCSKHISQLGRGYSGQQS